MLAILAAILWSPPPPINAGYVLEPVDPVLRTDMEFGSPRTRLRTQADLDHVTLAWHFTAVEMESFRNWYRQDIARGSAWFDLAVDLGNGVIETRACKFLEMWKATRRPGGGFDVSAKVEVR